MLLRFSGLSRQNVDLSSQQSSADNTGHIEKRKSESKEYFIRNTEYTLYTIKFSWQKIHNFFRVVAPYLLF